MGAPTTPPSWCEPISDADRELDPFEQSAFYIDDFAEMPRYFPDWLVEGAGIEVRIHLMSREQGRHAEIGFVAAGRGGVVRFAQDPSGWLKLTAEFEGRPVFTGYLDHPYENCEIWPEGAEVARKTFPHPACVARGHCADHNRGASEGPPGVAGQLQRRRKHNVRQVGDILTSGAHRQYSLSIATP